MAIILTGSTGVATPAVVDASGGNTATINSTTPTADSLQGFRNRIINGDMRIDQRNAGAAVTANDSYAVDRFLNQNDTDGVFSAQRDSSAPVGFVNSLKFTTTTADASLSATQRCAIQHRIEGTNVSDLAWGTANAKTVTLSFWVRSSLTGTFGGALGNSAANRSYPFTYSISSADTWEYKTVTIAGDTTGTWLTTTGIGLRVYFALGMGSTYSGTAGAWAASDLRSVTGATSVIGTLNATWYVTGVQLEVGSVATPFERKDYGRELALCQRYCFVPASGSRYVGQCDGTTRALIIYVFPQTMRSASSATLASAATYNVTNATGGTVAGTSVALNVGQVDTAQIGVTVASGLVAGNATIVTASGTTIFSAEL